MAIAYPNRRPPAGNASNGAREKRTDPVRVDFWFGKNRITEGKISYGDQRNGIFYIVEKVALQQCGSSSRVAILPLGGNLLLETPFPGLKALSQDTYKGIDTPKKDPCYKFHWSEPNEDGSTSTLTTWIRVADGYPERVRTDTEILDFTPVSAFSEDVAVPKLYQATLDQLHAEQQAMELLKKGRR